MFDATKRYRSSSSWNGFWHEGSIPISKLMERVKSPVALRFINTSGCRDLFLRLGPHGSRQISGGKSAFVKAAYHKFQVQEPACCQQGKRRCPVLRLSLRRDWGGFPSVVL